MNVSTRANGFVFSTMVLLLVTAGALYQSSNVLAQSDDNDGIINLNQPLYSEHFKLTSQKAVVINGTEAIEATFSGNGTTNGIRITSNGHGFIIPRAGGVVYITGKADFVTTPQSSGKATYAFQAIGNYGIALFNPNATGNLSFLSNAVAVYKVDMNSNGTNTFTMWKWGK
ncbi:MAG TPA: hypothetical protein VJ729_17420 [Nitrososphaeraceae archaeon]|nr:hypothetical protein [Nitrososphaeraceae archaeon]